MGLNHAFARLAVRHPHALVVEVPGSWRTRTAAERALVARGWRLALSPAEADVLVVCGRPGPQLAEAVEVVWHQMPGPRVRLDLNTGDDVGARLDGARAGLLDPDHHRHDAHHRPDFSTLLAEQPDDEGDGGGHEGMDHGGGHEGMDHGGGHEGMDHGGGHEGMGHGDMDMSPGGIPLAQGGEDRDGLEMDVLNVRLGPVLPHWPAGLVLRCSLQGDVIVEARAELLDATGHLDRGSIGLAQRMDNIACVLALAGWDDAAAEARRIRDRSLDDVDGPGGVALTRLSSKVRRARLLRWSLRGLRPLSEKDVHRHGLPAEAIGDTHDRLLGMLDRAVAGATTDHGPTYSTRHLTHLVTGLDLATARLVLASLDIHDLRADLPKHEVSHG